MCRRIDMLFLFLLEKKQSWRQRHAQVDGLPITTLAVRVNGTLLFFPLDEFSEVTEGFSGAEIEAAVKAGLLLAFMDGTRGVTTADITRRAGQIQPTSVIKREQVDSLRNWAKDHLAVSAGGSGVTRINDLMQGARALEM